MSFFEAMAFYSNGQIESFQSGGGISSNSDSEEQRFHAKENPSQRQHSSLTSALSSDSEQEEVSTCPAAEKPTTLPLAKKNTNSSDRSAVQNQSTLSRPNTNTRSALKPKNGVAEKRTKYDAFAKEKTASKKQLASKERSPLKMTKGRQSRTRIRRPSQRKMLEKCQL